LIGKSEMGESASTSCNPADRPVPEEVPSGPRMYTTSPPWGKSALSCLPWMRPISS
jgi:hypothetical protein